MPDPPALPTAFVMMLWAAAKSAARNMAQARFLTGAIVMYVGWIMSDEEENRKEKEKQRKKGKSEGGGLSGGEEK
jgi:hypothetical protein